MIRRYAVTGLHCLVLALELSALVALVLWPIMQNWISFPKESVFIGPGETLRFKIKAGQDDLVRGIRRVKVYYTTRADQSFADYYQSGTKGHGDFSEKYSLFIKFDGEHPYAAQSVKLPEGLFDFRIDFNFDLTAGVEGHPPVLEEMIVGDRPQDVKGELKTYQLNFPSGVCYGYRYIYKPVLHGYLTVFVVCMTVFFSVTFLTLIFAFSSNAKESKI